VESFDRRELLRRAGASALVGGAAAAWPGTAAGGSSSTGPLRRLARSLDGDLVTPGSGGYRRAKQLYDTRFDTLRPLAIAFCESVADVQRCVRWCSQHGVRPAARAGGLVIDVSRLDRIVTSAAGAEIGAGAKLGDVYDRLWQVGAAIPAGSCPTVGIAGLTLGGGIGFSSRKLGLTCDALQQLTIVTADGRVRTCSDRANRDLYWACRGGGGGSFGVVTAFEFVTFPVSTVTTYTASWPWERAAAVVDAWQRFAPEAPDELFSVCRLETAAGGPRVGSSGQFFGSEAGLRTLLAPLLAVGDPTTLSVAARSFIQAVRYFSGGGGRATFAAKSDYASELLPAAGIQVLVGAIEERQAAGGTADIILDSYGGAINRVDPSATAFVHRRERFSLQELASWTQGSTAGERAGLAWLRRLHGALRPYVSGFAYQNYIDPGLAGWPQAYFGSNYPRLRRIKGRVDPDNLFRFRQSIRG
jgi:FAD/FMN-containing dehydrogenase